jgi:hypothetical protein
MLAIIIYIGLFMWGMNSERLTLKHALGLAAIFVVQAGVGYAMFGADMVRTGAMSVTGWLMVSGLDLLIDIGVFMAGYAVGRYRRGKTQKVEDVTDTFS